MADDLLIKNIKCFQHCDRGINILCFSLPPVCPLCQENVYTTESRIPPYVVPSPFSSAQQCPLSIIIKPTNGTFITMLKSSVAYYRSGLLLVPVVLAYTSVRQYDNSHRDYTNSSNLHIGLTNSQGISYDFDEDGVNVDSSTWNECLAIDLQLLIPGHWWQQWDEVLQGFSLSSHWSKHRYHEDECNCFDFVINVLWHLNLEKVNPGLRSKLSLCEEIVLPCSKKAAKYITHYRKILKQGYVCQPCQ